MADLKTGAPNIWEHDENISRFWAKFFQMNRFLDQPIGHQIRDPLGNGYGIDELSDLLRRVFAGAQIFILIKVYFAFELVFLTFFLLDKKYSNHDIRFMA